MLQHRKNVTHFNDPGNAHALTFSCRHHLPLLAGDSSREWFCDAVNIVSKDLNYSVWAYVIMPDHVHLLVFPNEEPYSISSYLKRLKQSVSRKAKKWLSENDRKCFEELTRLKPDGTVEFQFWQPGGGYDRNIIQATALRKEISYIHANPVRKNLATCPLAWKWSSALDYEGRKNGPINVKIYG